MSLIKGRTVDSIVAPLTRIRSELEVVKEQATAKITAATQAVEDAMTARDKAIAKAQAKFAATKKVECDKQEAAEKEIADADQWLAQLPIGPNP